MLLTLNDDVRVILIKIADRLHNNTKYGKHVDYKQAKIASETFVHLCASSSSFRIIQHQNQVKEDLGLKYAEPEVYNDIVSKIKETKEEQDEYIKTISDVLEMKSLLDERIQFTIKVAQNRFIRFVEK